MRIKSELSNNYYTNFRVECNTVSYDLIDHRRGTVSRHYEWAVGEEFVRSYRGKRVIRNNNGKIVRSFPKFERKIAFIRLQKNLRNVLLTLATQNTRGTDATLYGFLVLVPLFFVLFGAFFGLVECFALSLFTVFAFDFILDLLCCVDFMEKPLATLRC